MGYGPNEDGEERDRFWNDMDRILDRVWNGYRLCILGYLYGWIGDRTRADIAGTFGVPEEWWSSMLKGNCVWVMHSLSTGVRKSTQGWQGVKIEWR